VLAWAGGRVPLFIELKHIAHTQPSLDAVVVERILAHEMADQVMIISFDHQALYLVKGLAPHLACCALYRTRVDDPVGLARGIGASAVMPLWQIVTAEDVASCHAAGLAVHVWGPDLDYPTLIAAGADCVNADYPAQVRRDFLEECHG
jgi:glycerophosphoryl diester phosphodiesterase